MSLSVAASALNAPGPTSLLSAPTALPSLTQDQQQALDTLKSITDPATKEASAREQVEREVSLATEKLKALRMLGIDDAYTASSILKRLDAVTQTYADAQKALSASRVDAGGEAEVSDTGSAVSRAKQVGAQLGEISAHSQAYSLLAGQAQGVAIEAQSILERADDQSQTQRGRARLTSITNNVFAGAKAISATGNPAQSLFGFDVSI